MKKILSFIGIASLLTSCCHRTIHSSTKYEVQDSISITTQTRYIDTTVHIDSSVSIVKIECDSNNKPHIVSHTQTHGSRKNTISQIDNNTFKVKCPADSLRLRIAYQDSLIQMYKSKITEITNVVEEKKGFFAHLKQIFAHILYTIVSLFLGALLYTLFKR